MAIRGASQWLKKSNTVSIFEKSKKDYLESYKLINLNPGKVMDKIHLEAVSRHTWRTRLWLGTEIRELPRTNNVWPICLSFMMRFLADLWRGEKWMLYTLTLTGSLMWSCIESLQPNWWGMDWINGLQGEKKIEWSSWFYDVIAHSFWWHFSGVHIGVNIVKHLKVLYNGTECTKPCQAVGNCSSLRSWQAGKWSEITS